MFPGKRVPGIFSSCDRRPFSQSSQRRPCRRYRVERELGRGGMATVYLAEDLRHERPVAFKVMRPELGSSPGGQAERTHWMALLRVEPRLDALRGHPRFEAVLARMAFP